MIEVERNERKRGRGRKSVKERVRERGMMRIVANKAREGETGRWIERAYVHVCACVCAMNGWAGWYEMDDCWEE